MRPAISTTEATGTTRWQEDDEISESLAHDATFTELLGVTRKDYERMDVAKPRVVKSPEPMATVSWSDARPMAEKLKDVSDAAFAIEAYRRGMKLIAVKRILSGTHYENGKRKHRRKSKRGGTLLPARRLE
jgi:hypothetical protein